MYVIQANNENISICKKTNLNVLYTCWKCHNFAIKYPINS